MTIPVFSSDNLSAYRDGRCLYRGLALELSAGDVLQLAGRNGSGKTTLMKQIAGLSNTGRGRRFWQGQDIAEDPQPFLRNSLYLGHLAGIKAGMTVAENLRYCAAIRGIGLPSERLAMALKLVSLSGYEEVMCHSLSAGQQRRVALARLFTEPALLWLLDEPFTAIDQRGVGELEQWIVAHHQRGGVTILTTHHALTLDCPLHRLDVSTAPGHESWQP